MLYAAQDQAPSAEGKVSVVAHAHTHAHAHTQAHTPEPSGLFGHPQNNRPSFAKNSQKSLLPLTSPGCNTAKQTRIFVNSLAPFLIRSEAPFAFCKTPSVLID